MSRQKYTESIGEAQVVDLAVPGVNPERPFGGFVSGRALAEHLRAVIPLPSREEGLLSFRYLSLLHAGLSPAEAHLALRAEGPGAGSPEEATRQVRGAGPLGLSPLHNRPFPPDGPSSRQRRLPTSRELPTICGVRYAVNGNLCKIFVPTPESKSAGVPPKGRANSRGDVGDFSRGSRRRMLNLLNSIDRERVQADDVWFLTLTYHNEWGHDFEKWKGHLATLWKRFRRRFGARSACLIWKLEFVDRKSGDRVGDTAPHYHCLLIWKDGKPCVTEFRTWIASAWNEIAEPGDEQHLLAGTQCDPARGWCGVTNYAAKYTSKQTQQLIDPSTGEIHKNGRWWGVQERSLLPIRFESDELTEAQSLALRRVLQKKAIAEESNSKRPNWRTVRFRKNRRGWAVRDETFYVQAGELLRLVQWVRREKWEPPPVWVEGRVEQWECDGWPE